MQRLRHHLGQGQDLFLLQSPSHQLQPNWRPIVQLAIIYKYPRQHDSKDAEKAISLIHLRIATLYLSRSLLGL